MEASSTTFCNSSVRAGLDAQSLAKPLSSNQDSSQTAPAEGGFDCNICLEFAQEPVVTLCGHLYCWPCIYKWLHLQSFAQPCPVCKSTISTSTLIPLYGRGKAVISAIDNQGVPRRPPAHWTYDHSRHHRQHQHQHNQNMSAQSSHPPDMNWMTRVMHPTVGRIAVAVFPWLIGGHDTEFHYINGGNYGSRYNSSGFYLMEGGSSPRMREVEQEVRGGLDKLLVFLSCFALLCLLLF